MERRGDFWADTIGRKTLLTRSTDRSLTNTRTQPLSLGISQTHTHTAAELLVFHQIEHSRTPNLFQGHTPPPLSLHIPRLRSSSPAQQLRSSPNASSLRAGTANYRRRAREDIQKCHDYLHFFTSLRLTRTLSCHPGEFVTDSLVHAMWALVVISDCMMTIASDALPNDSDGGITYRHRQLLGCMYVLLWTHALHSGQKNNY